MKKALILALTLVTASAFAAEGEISVDELKDIYEYCIDGIAMEDLAASENAILQCVNEELTDLEYPTIASYAELMKKIN